jgi:hypothetical protein
VKVTTTPGCRCWFTLLALRQGGYLGRGRKEGRKESPREGREGRKGLVIYAFLSSFAYGVHAGYLLHTSVMSDEVLSFFGQLLVCCV